jgi:hypothetical protein
MYKTTQLFEAFQYVNGQGKNIHINQGIPEAGRLGKRGSGPVRGLEPKGFAPQAGAIADV